MNAKRILIVDDEASKRQTICQVVKRTVSNADIDEARSFHSAMQKINNCKLDMIVLDMRLPTFDIAGTESGGRPRNFGGEEILQKMARRKTVVPTIVLTQYTVFADDSGDILNLEGLRKRLGRLESFRGLVHFSHSDPSWKTCLSQLLTDFFPESPT